MANLPAEYNDEELTNDSVIEYCEEDYSYTQEEDNYNNQVPTYDRNQPYYPSGYDQGYDRGAVMQQKIELANNITNTIGGVLKSKERTKQLEAITKKDIAKIGAKYKTAEDGINKEFAQREKSLDELYKQLKSDNIDLKLEAMRQIGNMHSSSVMQGLKDVKSLYDDDNDVDKLLEDF